MAIVNAAGSQFAYGATFGTTVTATAFTNATSAVITAAGHGIVVGDFVEILDSPWQRLTGRVFRASAVATNDVTLEGCDTSSTTLFPASGGVGTTYRRIITWTNITQVVRDIEISGGDLKTADITGIADVVEKAIPTFRSPPTLGLPFFADASMSWLAALRTATVDNSIKSFRMITPAGNRVVLSGYASIVDFQNVTDSIWRGRLDVLGIAPVTAYAT